MKILYVCPLAHYTGHYPYAAVAEPRELAKAGAYVSLLTFCGITGDPKVVVKHHTVMGDNRLFKFLRRSTLSRWLLVFVETSTTIMKAIKVCQKQKYDIIYLRDGQPFFFVTHLLSLPFRGLRWVVSMTGSDIYFPAPGGYKLRDRMMHRLYVFGQGISWGRLLRPLYEASHRRNRFEYVTQNNEVKEGYEQCLGGSFVGRVRSVPLGMSDDYVPIPKDAARKKLGLPQDKMVLLSFGAPHAGKDTEAIFGAVAKLLNVFLVCAGPGMRGLSLGSSPDGLRAKYGLDGRVAVFDHYIGETDEDRPYFFASADALVLSYTKEFTPTSSMLWQAARYKIPVISSSANLLGEMVREYNMGLLFEAGDADSLAETIRHFDMLDSDSLEQIKVDIGKFAVDHSHQKWAARTIEVCEGIRR